MALQMAYHPYQLDNETILTETTSNILKLPEFCLSLQKK